MRKFSIAGPVVPERHYCIPPLSRVDLNEILELIEDMAYFVLHAPRQTGKTSTLLALADTLNDAGKFRCVYANFEVGQAAREEVPAAMQAVLGQLGMDARMMLRDDFVHQVMRDVMARYGPYSVLNVTLANWAESSDKPLVLLIDEIDSLLGDSLISVLRQLRAGYHRRPGRFPQSVILCGVRDVRDYQIYSSAVGDHIKGGSAFNIKAESLRLGDFSEGEVRTLLSQHTAETGQEFGTGVATRIWDLTRGQPWLVNALAHQACFRDGRGRERSRPIGVAAMDQAREVLIRSRVTHLDQLADKLSEARVRRVVEPLLAGTERHEFSSRDLEYVRDLGLVAPNAPVRIANPIYREVVPRELTYSLQEGLDLEPDQYRDRNGALNVTRLLGRFQVFFRRHSEFWTKRFGYEEAGPQLVLQAFLQRVVNSGGRVEREYGLGRRRTDLLILWPIEDGREFSYVIECKVVRPKRSLKRVIAEGERQTAAYMDLCGAESGHLVIFDMRPGRSWEERVFRKDPRPGRIPITVWGM